MKEKKHWQKKVWILQEVQVKEEDVQVKDISGAGDTFLAGLTVEYVRSNDIVKAIDFAQECTKIVVQKHGVSTVWQKIFRIGYMENIRIMFQMK